MNTASRAREGVGMINRHQIPYAHWSHKVARFDPNTGLTPEVHGEIVFAVEDVSQAIANLVLTPKRSVPTNPEKGCDVEPFIDRHEAEAVPNLTRNIWDAISEWEPRAVLDAVTIVQTEFSRYVARIAWRPLQSVLDDLFAEPIVTEVNLV